VENRLRLIEREGTMPDQEIVLKEIEPTNVLYLRETLEGVDRIPAMIQDGYIALMSNGVTPTAPAFSIFHDPEFKPEEFDYEIAYPVPEGTPPLETPAGRKFSHRVVPGGRAGVLVHHGSYEDIDQAYGRIGQWITDNGMQITGPPQEAYLTGPDDPAGLVTEIRWPVS
jgi:effector-binding domain-containing protein